jgi:carboxymethylenebutenolidase
VRDSSAEESVTTTVRLVNETLTITTPDGDMGIHVVRPDGDGPFPVIVFFHHGPGLDGASKKTMQLLADAGYYVVSHDRYHRDGAWYSLTPEMRNDQDAMSKFWGVLMGTTEDMVDTDTQAVFGHLAGDPAARDGAMGCIGYCIGARSVVVMMARHSQLAAGVGLHPSFCTTDAPDSPHLLVPGIAGDMYIAFGSADKMQSPEDNVPFIDAVNAKTGSKAEVLDGADHGFGVLGSPAHHEVAASHAYEKAFALFAAKLK